MTVSTSLRSPFAGGMVTDRAPWEIGPQFSVFAEDGYSPEGVFRQRGAWAYDGTVADMATNLFSVARAKFILADATRSLTSGGAAIYLHNSAAAGTSLVGAARALPRCIYDDQLIWCFQDGLTPLLRYAGSAATPATRSSGTPTYIDGEATVTGMTFTAAPAIGSFLQTSTTGSYTWLFPRILQSSSTAVTLMGVRASSTSSLSAIQASMTSLNLARGWSSVNVYDAGTLTIASSTATGYGTDWDGAYNYEAFDNLLLTPPTGGASVASIGAPITATSLVASGAPAQSAKSNYQILRAMPFKDVAAHNGSFWGTGVAQYPTRVYVGPPGWDLAFPPGYTMPFDPTVALNSSNPNDFLMDFIDVPTAYDGDANVAILPSPNPLLVLKRNAVHGVFGSYPQFSQSLMADGVGCIDIRSAQSFAEGQFWCGESGIYWYTGGRIQDITAGRINREWRALTRDFDYGVSDYCSLGVEHGHVIVHITTGGGTTRRTYLYDLSAQSWQSRVSNFTPRYMFSSRIAGERSKLLSVSDDRQGRVLDFAPAIDGSGTAKDAAGTGPALQAWTPESIDGQDIDADMRMLDLAVHANVYDAGAAGATTLGVSVVTQDALTDPTTATTTLDAIASDAVDRIDRHYYRRVDKRGRRHQVRVAVGQVGTDSAATKVEVSEITATFRSGRDRT